MTAALFWAEPDDVVGAAVGSTLRLGGSEGRHAVAVKRIRVGEHVDLGDGRGTVLRTQVTGLSGRESLQAQVLAVRREPAPQPRVVVVQALPKGDRAETAVETLTEVGVDRIVPWQAERCVVRWAGERATRGRAKWVTAAWAAGKQARRAWVPEVAQLADSDAVERLIADAALGVLLHEDAGAPLPTLAVPATGEVVLVVGPEGGLSPQELRRFAAAGAHVAGLGPTVLRTSTAGTVAAALVLASAGRWSPAPSDPTVAG